MGFRPLRFGFQTVAVAVLCLLALPVLEAGAEDDADVRVVLVPDVRNRRPAEARRLIERAGLKVGKIYQISTAQILRWEEIAYPVGYVYQQQPEPGVDRRVDRPVNLLVSTVKEGVLPLGMAEALEKRAALRGKTPSPSSVPAPAPAVGDTPGRDSSDRGPSEPRSSGPDRPVAEGSPDAPRPAPPPNPNVVPPLLGLELSDADQLVRECKMKLHVERVPGHPIGRVLEQMPEAGSPRPPGAFVKVIVTAGGDFESERMPGAPAVYLPQVDVPDLLDRTYLQAERILGAVGLKVEREVAKRGLPGLVMDQMPAAGGRAPRGGIVRVWIGPPDPNAPQPEPSTPKPAGPIASRPVAPGSDTPAKEPKPEPAPPLKEPEVPAPKPPLAPGPLPGGLPEPLAPAVGTKLPRGETVPVGFTWRGVKGAEAYVLEVEEQGAEGRWMANARKPSRKTAVVLDIERLSSKGSGHMRWRVRAVIDGREGQPSKWVLLK